MNDLQEPDLAMPYFFKAIQGVQPGDPYVVALARTLREKNRADLAEAIERADRAPAGGMPVH